MYGLAFWLGVWACHIDSRLADEPSTHWPAGLLCWIGWVYGLATLTTGVLGPADIYLLLWRVAVYIANYAGDSATWTGNGDSATLLPQRACVTLLLRRAPATQRLWIGACDYLYRLWDA